jgi:beta-phosphoglucomutase-like phosphatase (HAD superfamily)
MKLILFDIDGTLINAGKAPGRAFQRAFHEVLGMAPVTAGVRTHGATDPQIRHDVALATLGRPFATSEYEGLNARYVELLYREIEVETEYRIMPGVTSLLNYLTQRGDVAVGLQTGNLKEAVPAKLGRGELNHYFKAGGFGTDSPYRAEIIRTAIARMKAVHEIPSSQHTDVIVVGDAPQDVAAACEAGVRAIGVTTGIYSAQDLVGAGPCTVLPDLSDLAKVTSLIGACSD